MKRSFFLLLLIVTFLLSCQQNRKADNSYFIVEKEFLSGNFQKVSQLSDSLKTAFPGDTILVWRLDSLTEMCHRISFDFSLSEDNISARLQRVMGDFTPEQKTHWEKAGLLEYRVIDGEKRYFKRAATNLRLLLAHQEKSKLPQTTFQPDKSDSFRIEKAKQVISLNDNGLPVDPVNIRIIYTLTVDADAVPDGETVRCWLPFPKESHARQQEINLIRTAPGNHFIAPDSSGQRSLYVEQAASAGKPTVFELELSYRPFAQYFNLDSLPKLPYDKTSAFYRKYTSEEKPHIVFTDKIRHLSDSIVKGETDPVEKVRKIYYWINTQIPWAGALEYSTMPNIPEYVMDNRHGDCGMQTLLFMTLARYNGIPVKWQSGWYFFPDEVNLHDWCEVWYEGTGWVPLDMSFGLLPSENKQIREYYISGIDAYRFIVNDATGTPFIPEKKHFRSEPVDFQRGEVEWKGGNLYFDQWDYHMEVFR
jgi:hypothetical protein